jgi:RNA polymerase sigma factor (sigma-70 family)
MYLSDDYLNIDDLVDKVKSGDKESFWELIDYYQPIIQSCANQVHNKYKTIEAEDLKTECIFIIEHLCKKYDKNKSYFSYFLNTRLQPYLISKVKSKYLEKVDVVSLNSIDESTLQDSSFDLDEMLINNSKIHEGVESLPVKNKQVIDLFYFKNLTQLECATILNISQPAFNKRLKKSLNLLKDKI